MSIIQSFVNILPLKLQVIAIRLLYYLKGRKLGSFSKHSNKFFIYEVDGYFVPSDSIGWFVTMDYYNDWVKKISGRMYIPQKGDVVVDIGSGLGEECLVFSSLVGNTGHVYAIEANPEVFDVLSRVVALNKFTNVNLNNLAISTHNDDTDIYVSKKSFIGGSIGVEREDDLSFSVRGVRMDTFIDEKNISKIDLLKVNIEGAERFVIDSLGKSISLIKHVAISCHDFRFRSEGNEFFRTRALVEQYLIKNNFILIPDAGDRIMEDWVYAYNKRLI